MRKIPVRCSTYSTPLEAPDKKECNTFLGVQNLSIRRIPDGLRPCRPIDQTIAIRPFSAEIECKMRKEAAAVAMASAPPLPAI
jgi:hypothetical protein